MAPSTDVRTVNRSRSAVLPFAFGAFIAAWFVYFNWGDLKVGFAPDDMMNMAYYWRVEPWRVILDQFAIWGGHYRPMAAAFYLPLFHFFRLNPMPYHAAMLALLLVDVWLTYRFARRLGCEVVVAGLAALAVAYHPGLKDLYYNTAFIYDVLCMLFYLAAFTYYLRLRPPEVASPRPLRARQMAVFLALYVCALNSKEMAVTLPVMLLVYEWLYHRPEGRGFKDLLGWLRGPGRAALAAGFLNLLYIYGKVLGPEAMTRLDAYRPVFTAHRFMDFQRRELISLLLYWPYRGWFILALLWLTLLYLALRRPRPVLLFCWIFMWVGPLPIEFLEGRDGACLAIPLAAWVIFAATVFVDIARAAARSLAAEPGFRSLGRERLAVLAIGLGLFFLGREFRHQRAFAQAAMDALGETTNHVLREFQAANPHVRPHARVVFLNDPFVEWDIAFIGELWFHDRTVSYVIQRITPLPPDELARADYQFDLRDGKLVQVK